MQSVGHVGRGWRRFVLAAFLFDERDEGSLVRIEAKVVSALDLVSKKIDL